MKKLLGILFLGLLLSNISFANIDDLDIPIAKAEVETKIIKLNKEYRQSCEAGVTVEHSYIDLKFNSYIDVVGKKQTLVEEITFDLGEDGSLIMKSQQKIKSDGTLSKVKASSDYIPGSVEYSKKDIKQIKKMFKTIAKYLGERAINYGEKLTLGIKREDANKKMLKMFKDFEGMYLAAGEDPKEVKEFIKILKKDSNFEMIKEYLGTTELNGEKFYAVRWDATLEYVGNITEMKEALEGFSYNSVYFIHAPSGYRSAMKIVTAEPDPSTEMSDDMICTIYKNDQMLTEVSISELEDKAVAKKTETKETKKKVEKVEEEEEEEFEFSGYTKKINNFPTNTTESRLKGKTMSDLVFMNDKERNSEVKEHWNKNYFQWGGKKAWAESQSGAWAWKSSLVSERDAVKLAVDSCNGYNSNRLPSCVVTNVSDKHLTYKEQADWMKEIYGETTLAAKIIGNKKKKVVKKKKSTQTDSNNSLAQQIKDLNEMYKSGALTKEEFEKAKEKLLN
tara:strand:+ start:4510 stop:6027 length:1518 start_codon:yes stop_codon:yes gene_type:complete